MSSKRDLTDNVILPIFLKSRVYNLFFDYYKRIVIIYLIEINGSKTIILKSNIILNN